MWPHHSHPSHICLGLGLLCNHEDRTPTLPTRGALWGKGRRCREGLGIPLMQRTFLTTRGCSPQGIKHTHGLVRLSAPPSPELSGRPDLEHRLPSPGPVPAILPRPSLWIRLLQGVVTEHPSSASGCVTQHSVLRVHSAAIGAPIPFTAG